MKNKNNNSFNDVNQSLIVNSRYWINVYFWVDFYRTIRIFINKRYELDSREINKEIYLTTSREDYWLQPLENSSLEQGYQRKKNEFSVFVDAKFRNGVFLSGSGINPYIK